MHSHKIQISNLTLLNSPSWNVHPVYCSDIVIQGITILAPVTSPNTDGINPGLSLFSPKNSLLNINNSQPIMMNPLLNRFLHKHKNRGLLHRLRRRLHSSQKWLGRVWYKIRYANKTTDNPAPHLHFTLQRSHCTRQRNVRWDRGCQSRRYNSNPH